MFSIHIISIIFINKYNPIIFNYLAPTEALVTQKYYQVISDATSTTDPFNEQQPFSIV